VVLHPAHVSGILYPECHQGELHALTCFLIYTPSWTFEKAKVYVLPRIFKTLSKRPDDRKPVDFCWECMKIPLFSQLPKEKKM